MLQFYFLSVLLNIVSGLILVYVSRRASADDLGGFGDEPADGGASPAGKDGGAFVAFVNDTVFRLVLGAVTAFVGLVKLAYTVQNDLPLVGDLVPAVAGLLGGASLLIDYFCARSGGSLVLPDALASVFVGGKKAIGLACIAAGVLHFIFPRVLFL